MPFDWKGFLASLIQKILGDILTPKAGETAEATLQRARNQAGDPEKVKALVKKHDKE